MYPSKPWQDDSDQHKQYWLLCKDFVGYVEVSHSKIILTCAFPAVTCPSVCRKKEKAACWKVLLEMSTSDTAIGYSLLQMENLLLGLMFTNLIQRKN